jgi:two-component system response regulator HydG
MLRLVTSAPVARAPAMVRALRLCDLYAPSRTCVVLVGETGTGKSFLARYLHERGDRTDRPFVDVTAAELLDGLDVAQLFGHERGAFTGALVRRQGFFGEAADGTLLLDDLHLLRQSTQAKLLRALSSGWYRPLGAQRDYAVRCRLVVGLKACPDLLVRDGTLLMDLRYRLGHCVIRVPRLEERREEIAELAERFLAGCPEETGVTGPVAFAPEVVAALEAAAWPGNVRDLKATVEAAYLHARGERVVRLEHLPPRVQWVPRFESRGEPERNERAIVWALWRTGNRVGEAARLIGAHRNTVSAHLGRRRMRDCVAGPVPDERTSLGAG